MPPPTPTTAAAAVKFGASGAAVVEAAAVFVIRAVLPSCADAVGSEDMVMAANGGNAAWWAREGK